MDRLTGESQKPNRKVPTLQAIEPCDSKTVPTAEIDSRSSPYQFFTVDYGTSKQRAAELPSWIHRYNWHRPHGSIGAVPPIRTLGLTGNNLLRLHS